MEISMQELRDLIADTNSKKGAGEPITSGAGVFDHLVGKRVLTRTYMSGVSAGTVESIDCLPGGTIAVTFGEDAVRIWSWSSLEGETTLACSDLASKGGKVKTERHQPGVVVTACEFEFHPVSEVAWSAIAGAAK